MLFDIEDQYLPSVLDGTRQDFRYRDENMGTFHRIARAPVFFFLVGLISTGVLLENTKPYVEQSAGALLIMSLLGVNRRLRPTTTPLSTLLYPLPDFYCCLPTASSLLQRT